MHHYRESGLPNVFLENGYRELRVADGIGVAIEDVDGLHRAIATTIVHNLPFMTGPELRFVRKYLDLSQSRMAAYLGVEEQTVRRWEKLARVPKQGDQAVRLMFRDLTRAAGRQNTLAELLARIAATAQPNAIHFAFTPEAKAPWQATELAA